MVRAKQEQKKPSGPSNLFLVAAATAFIGVMAFVVLRPSGGVVAPETQQTQPAQTPPAQTPPAAEPAQNAQTQPPQATQSAPVETAPAKQGTKDELPPLYITSDAARPPEVVRAVYEFAARHPEVLQYVPCFCGCERQGHKGNDDCFVKSRDTSGKIEWDPHGMACAVCIDVAHDAMQMTAIGADPEAIRAAVEKKYGVLSPTRTPTPHPEHTASTN